MPTPLQTRHRSSVLASPAPETRPTPRPGYEGTNRSISAQKAVLTSALPVCAGPGTELSPAVDHEDRIQSTCSLGQDTSGISRSKATSKPAILPINDRNYEKQSTRQAESNCPHILPAPKTQEGTCGLNEKFISRPGGSQQSVLSPGTLWTCETSIRRSARKQGPPSRRGPSSKRWRHAAGTFPWHPKASP